MNIIEEIRMKTTFDTEDLIRRLKNDLGIKNKSSEQVQYALFDTLNIILNEINRRKVPKELYSTLYRMTKDYWYLNNYDKLLNSKNKDETSNLQNQKIKSIAIGDTKTTFADTSSQIDINGVTYNTGTIEFSENVLIEKYKNELYKYRKMRW